MIPHDGLIRGYSQQCKKLPFSKHVQQKGWKKSKANLKAKEEVLKSCALMQHKDSMERRKGQLTLFAPLHRLEKHLVAKLLQFILKCVAFQNSSAMALQLWPPSCSSQS